MKKARYIDDEGKIIPVEADIITPLQNEEKYRNHLYCENPKCFARVFYVERQNPKLNRLFKTFPSSSHIDGCDNEVDHNGTKKATYYVRGEGTNVSDKHIMNTLRDAYKNYKKDLYPEIDKKPTNHGGRKKKGKSKSPSTDDGSEQVAVTKESPSTSGVDIETNGEKEPNIHRNEVSRMIVDKNEPFKEVHGLIESVHDDNGDINIFLKGTHGGKCRVYFGNPFKEQHPKEYNLLYIVKEYILQSMFERDVQFHCFGEIKQSEIELSVQVYSYAHLLINGKTFYDIVLENVADR